MLLGIYQGKPVRKNRKKMSEKQSSDLMIIGDAYREAIPLIKREIRHILDHSKDIVYLILPASKDTRRFNNDILVDVMKEFADYSYYERFFVKYDLDEIADTILSKKERTGHIWLYFLCHRDNSALFHSRIRAIKEAGENPGVSMAFQYDLYALEEHTPDSEIPSLWEGIEAAYGQTALRCSLACTFKKEGRSVSEILKGYARSGGCISEKVKSLRLEELDDDSSCNAVVIGKDETGKYHRQGFTFSPTIY